MEFVIFVYDFHIEHIYSRRVFKFQLNKQIFVKSQHQKQQIQVLTELHVTNRHQKDANNVSSKKLKYHDVSKPCCISIHRIKR